MNDIKKRLILISVTLGLTTSGLSLTTAAWFGGRGSIATINELGGSVLHSYFHSGTGTESDPFTITTPWHYENFAKLHYTIEGFAEQKYHFALGYPLNGGNTRYFYGTDEKGAVDYDVTNSTVLNLGGESFAPIGSEEKPFLGELNGNDLTVTNFTVNGNGYHDIGIFGYVGENEDGSGASIHNVYYNNFTINTKGASASQHQHSDDIETRVHNENAHVGYIAGHVVHATDLNNIYVNNCTIDGKSSKDRTIDTFGYFGKVEYDHTGGERQSGNNYSFDLSAREVYQAIDSNYNSIRDNPLRSRVGVDDDDKDRHYADYDFPLSGEPDWENNRASHPVSEAITRVNANTYRLNGTTTESYSDRSYSLSTIGYQPLSGNIRNEYEVSSTDSRWTNPDDVTLDKNGPAIDKQYEVGNFFRYSTADSQWYYQHSENDGVSKRDAKITTINLSCLSSFDLHTSIFPGSPEFVGATAYFYLDGERIYTSNVSCSVSLRDRYYQYRNVSIDNPSFTWPISRGTHYYSFFITFKCNNTCCRYGVVYDSNTPVKLRNSNTRYYEIKQSVLNYGVSEYDAGVLNFNANKSLSGENCADNNGPTITWDESPVRKYDGVIPTIVSPNSYEIPLTGTKRSDGSVAPLKESTIESFTRETITETEYDEVGNPHEVTRKVWVASDNPTRSPDNTANPVYLSDAQSLIDNNYKFKNIDIVGGNVNFYYLGSILFIPVNLEVITLPPETQNTNIVEMPSMSDLDSMSQFYATKYCPGSIVMYVNNTGNPLDNIDTQLGHVEFTYANMNIQGRTLINVTRPSFKKGNGNFVNVESIGRVQEGEQFINFVSTFEGDITESGARQASYVCLNKEGKMLGVYDINGNPGYGFFKEATNEPAEERYRHITYTPGTTQYNQNPYGTYEKDTNGTYVLDKERVDNIDTYVIVLGCSSNASTNGTYISDIKFSYKAHEGLGGSFGPIGYRDATDTVNDTILNFYFDAAPELNYSITVYFDKNDSIYYITFSADGEITINIFNYEISNYSIYFNGSKLCDESGNNLESNEVIYKPGG